MATTEEAPPAVAATTTEVEATVNLQDFVKTFQDTWDKVDDKYAVTSLGIAGFVGLWASAGMISAIDRLPLLPVVFELVGIGYTGWFAYKNLIFKPEREALVQKIKDTYEDIIGIS